LLKSLGNLQKPRERNALWTADITSPPSPLLKERGALGLPERTVFWAERELCILAGDGGVGKSLVALQIARQLTLPMQNSECKISPSPNPSPEREGLNSFNSPPNVGGVAESRGGIQTNNTPSPLRGTPTDASDSTQSPTLGGELEGASEERFPVTDEIPKLVRDDVPRKVLYIDWELTEEEFVARWGGEVVPENFFWMGFHTDGKMPQHIPDKIDWLLQNFATTVHDTGANVLIIDQPDRLHLSPQKWNEFLLKLKAMMRKNDLSVMLVLSNKSRHLGRPCGLNNIPKGNILIPVADSVIMMAQNQRRTCERYFKVLKNRNRASAENLEFVDIIELEELDGYLNIRPWGYQRERDMLPPNAAERKNQRIMEAEKLWNSGLSCLEVGEKMYSTIKSWLRPLLNPNYGAKPIPHPGPLPMGEGDNTPSPLRGTPPTLGGELRTPPPAFGGHPLLSR
jgi:hypothetical protein